MYVGRKILLILSFLFTNIVCGQVVLWSEDFESYADKDVVAVDNNTNDVGVDWTLVNTALNTGTFQVQNSNSINGSNSFSANRANGYAVNGSIWTSEVIDVSDYSTIEIGVTIEEVGNLEVEDFIDVEYNLNGTGWVDMTNGQHNNDFGGPLLATDNLVGVLTTIQIRVKSYSDANGEQIIFDDVYVNGIVALPVELLYFKSNIVDSSITFNWATGSEINNDYFTIEESKDGINFETIHFVEGAGNSTDKIEYSVQTTTNIGLTYYRLKQVDFDGTFDYSPLIAIDTTQIKPEIVSVYTIDGIEVPLTHKGLVFIKYSDGSFKKRFNR